MLAPDTALEHHATLCTVVLCIPTHQDGYQQLSPKWHDTRSFTVKVNLKGPLWKRHWEQIRSRYAINEDADHGLNYIDRYAHTINNSVPAPQKDELTTQSPSDKTNQQTVPEYGRHYQIQIQIQIIYST